MLPLWACPECQTGPALRGAVLQPCPGRLPAVLVRKLVGALDCSSRFARCRFSRPKHVQRAAKPLLNGYARSLPHRLLVFRLSEPGANRLSRVAGATENYWMFNDMVY